MQCVQIVFKLFLEDGSDLRGATSSFSLAYPGQSEGFFAAPHLVRDEVVACGVQAAGDVGQTHCDLYEQADTSLRATVHNHSLVHLKATTEKLLTTILREKSPPLFTH